MVNIVAYDYCQLRENKNVEVEENFRTDLSIEVIIMKAVTYVMLGVASAIAYQRISENQPMLSREMRKMMKNNSKAMRKIREIF